MGISIYLYQGQQTFFVKGQRVNILEFAGRSVTIAST